METACFCLFSVPCLLTALGASQPRPPAATQPKHWFVDSLVKVFPEDAPGKQATPGNLRRSLSGAGKDT